MKRHPFNVFSFGFGMVLILLAIRLVVPDEVDGLATLRWLLPLALVLVGVSMLGSLFRRREADPVEAMGGALEEDQPEVATESAST
jgi:uncharacterized membrane protein HdeD (DUF308 family)